MFNNIPYLLYAEISLLQECVIVLEEACTCSIWIEYTCLFPTCRMGGGVREMRPVIIKQASIFKHPIWKSCKLLFCGSHFIFISECSSMQRPKSRGTQPIKVSPHTEYCLLQTNHHGQSLLLCVILYDIEGQIAQT